MTPKSKPNNTYEMRLLILRTLPGATTILRRVIRMLYKADDNWHPTRKQAWDEPEALRLLQRAGELVDVFEATGARMPQRELYHAHIIAAHDARDMEAYQMALNGYVEAAREASRQAAYQKARRRGRSDAT
jgi:hypothetical protein